MRKNRSLRSAIGVLLSAGVLWAQQPLDNDAILQMVKSGVSPQVIVDAIAAEPGSYALSPDDIIRFKRIGVSDAVLGAMLMHRLANPTVAASAAPEPPIILEEGTPVKLRLTRNLSSADARVGDNIDFEVLEEVDVTGVTAIAKGSSAIGSVTAAQHKRRMARGGKLDLTIDYVRLADSEKAALRAVKETSGGGHAGVMAAGIVATSLVVWPAAPFFLFMHGKDTTIPKGTEITAYVNGDMKLDRARFPKTLASNR